MTEERFTPEGNEKALDANLGAIEDALEKARAELSAMSEAASTADSLADTTTAEYSLHEVSGVGRYAVVRRTGWQPLLKTIHDHAADINFSTTQYPTFDKIIGDNFQSPYLLNPLHDRYESYQSLRDNIAAVRNFLMETYYVDTPAGMTPEKAKQALSEIADYIGKGLNNNYLFLGVLSNHHIGKPFISIDEASRPNGEGAQYIYEKILEIHRQSNWTRPFAAVLSLFGGHTPPDWMLPPAHETEFTQLISKDIAAQENKAPSSDTLKAGIASVESLEAARQKIIDQHQLGHAAQDLNSMGDQLLHIAGGMQDVALLSEPVRRDAIEIAKDILRKLRASLGDVATQHGLNLPPNDDASALGAIKGVALVYERMIGWARHVDASIMQHPSVVAGVQAIGQIGMVAKIEALRIATLSGNSKLAEKISGEVSRLPEAYRSSAGTRFSELTDRIESGMNTLLARIQTIGGPSAQLGNSASREIGQSISQPPTAGVSQQISNSANANNAAKLNQQVAAAQNAFRQSQALTQQSQQTKITTTVSTTTNNTAVQQPQRTVQVGRQINTGVRPAPSPIATAAPNNTNKTATPQFPANATSSTRNNNELARREQERLEAENQRMLELQRQQKLALQKAAVKMTVQKIDPSLLKGFQNATNTRGMGPVAPVKKATAPTTVAKPPSPPISDSTPPSPLVDEKNPLTPPPHRGGRGI